MTDNVDLSEITVGDNQRYSFTFTDGGGTPYNISGWTLYFTLKKSKDNPDSDAVISKDITNHDYPTEGETSFELKSNDTDIQPGVYTYDFQIKNDTGEVRTISTGRLRFIEGVTARS